MSVFTPRRETVTVPQGANSFSVVISSSGPATLVGVFAVTGITIQSKGPRGVAGVTYMLDSRVPDSRDIVWGKSGTRPTMATALHLDAGDEEPPVFIINDDDIKAHADWITGIRALPTVVPGETLELQWSEVYCAGIGGSFPIVYERLPAGVHRFEVEELSLTGVPLGAITTVAVKVPRPYWQSIWFWAAGLSVTAILSALGTRLSHISLLSAFAQSGSPNQEVSAHFGQITAMSRELIGALSETVWMLNPKNNELEALVDFLCRLVSELCRLAEIRCRIDALSVIGNVPVSHKFRHNVSLAVKEIVNNALKHSFATEIKMSIQVEGKLLKITVADNGVGITREPGKTSLGLDSISQRMASIRGKCDITPIENDGLRISLEAPITCLCAVSSAEEALVRVPKYQPDVVLMDINLPGISGIDCIRELKSKLPRLEVVMLTAYEEEDNIFRALKEGASGYLLKSSTPDISTRRSPISWTSLWKRFAPTSSASARNSMCAARWRRLSSIGREATRFSRGRSPDDGMLSPLCGPPAEVKKSSELMDFLRIDYGAADRGGRRSRFFYAGIIFSGTAPGSRFPIIKCRA